ncbi:MAG: hypothetical protein PHT78_06690 [Desulfitobacteriaceae bacterium]|nr:hypothetical protein [Desulfitobacteriaceae bacterium]
MNKKLIVGAKKTTLVIYQNGNVHAKGGYRKPIPKAYYGAKESPFKYSDESDLKEPVIAGLYHTKNYKQRKKNRKETFKDLIENNFQYQKSLFITLTFDPSIGTEIVSEPIILPPELEPYHIEIDLLKIQNELFSPDYKETKTISPKFQDLSACHAEFKKFIQRMNYRYDNFKYVAVFSKQANTGVWHYHMICNLKFIRFDELKEIWGLGSTYIRSMKSKGAMYKTINYCIKNMVAYSDNLKGEKGYLASRSLNRSIVLRSWEGAEQRDFKAYKNSLDEEISNGLKYTHKRITEHKYMGKCESEDGIFVEYEERSCICKYYTYPINSEDQFKFVVATRKEKDI